MLSNSKEDARMSLVSVKVRFLGVKAVNWESADGKKSGTKFFMDVLDTVQGSKRLRIQEKRFNDMKNVKISADVEIGVDWITSDDGTEWLGISEFNVVKSQ